MAVTQKVTLYNNKFTVPPVINAVQNDTDRQVEAYFGDFTLQVGMTGKLSFIRSDGTHYEVSATLNTGANTATAELDQALTQAGVTQAQLKITDSGNVGSTFTFMIKVQPDVAGISVEQDGWSAEEFNERLTTAEQDIEDLAEEVDTDYAKKVGSYDDLSAGTASGLIGKSGVTDTVPYTYRAIPHDSTREVMRKIVGATVGWNQLFIPQGKSAQSGVVIEKVDDNSIRIHGASTANIWQQMNYTGRPMVGHKYFLDKGSDSNLYSITNDNKGISTGADKRYTIGSPTTNQFLYVNLANGVEIDVTAKPMFIDLTAMLGSTIADYVYSLETATAGAGVAWLKSHFPKAFNEYQPYDAGSLKSVEGLVSHDTVGFNQWNEEWENGAINTSTGTNVTDPDRVRTKGYFDVLPSTAYYSHNSGISSPSAMIMFWYDSAKTFISCEYCGNQSVTSPSNARYARFYMGSVYGSVYNNDICINLSDSQRNGQYEPYTHHSYPLDPTQELRGIFKLDSANNLYADGDEWYADGTKNTRYGIVDLGTLGDWMEYTNYPGLFYLNVVPSGAKIPASNTVLPSLIANGYIAGISRDIGTSGHTKGEIALAAARTYISNDTYAGNASGFRTAISGVYLVYELATQTESTAPSFADVQIIDSDGTEEFMTDCIVAVGNETFYADDLVGKLDDLPALPVEAGTYRLKVTVTAGVPSYEWVTT